MMRRLPTVVSTPGWWEAPLFSCLLASNRLSVMGGGYFMSTWEDEDGDDTVSSDTGSPVYCVHWVWTQDFHLKVRGEVGLQCTDIQDLYPKVRADMGTQCTDTRDLYLKVRGEEGTQWSRHTEVIPPLWSPCLQWTKRLRLGMMSKGLTVWSDWQLNPCRQRAPMTAEGNSSSIASYQK